MIITTAETTEIHAAQAALHAASTALAGLQRNFRPETEKAPAREALTTARVRWFNARRDYFRAYGKPVF